MYQTHGQIMNSYTLALLAGLSMLACQSKPKQESTSAVVAVDDSAASLSKRPGPDAPRSAADRLVRALYFEHSKKENPLRETRDRAVVDQFFAPALANHIWARQGKRAAGINPLLGVSDTDVSKIWVEPAAVGGTRAVVYVTFQKAGKPQEIKVELVRIDQSRWRIAELTYPDGRRLSES